MADIITTHLTSQTVSLADDSTLGTGLPLLYFLELWFQFPEGSGIGC